MKSRVLLLTGILVPALLFGSVIWARLHTKPSAQITSPVMREAVDEWSKQKFTPIGDRSNLEALVKSIPVTQGGGCSLSREQIKEIQGSVYNLIFAFNEGSYEAYRRFRTPIAEYQINPQKTTYNKSLLERFYVKSGESIPSQPEEIEKMLWARNFGGNAYSNYFVAVSTNTSSIKVEKLGQLPKDLTDLIQSEKNAGIVYLAPTYIFNRKPETILAGAQPLYVATVSALISRAEPDPPSKIFCRLYWDDLTSKWLPSELASTFVGQRKRDPMF